MTRCQPAPTASCLLAATLALGVPAHADEPPEVDPLSLGSADEGAGTAAKDWKLQLEAAAGTAKRRDTGGAKGLRRLSADFVYSTKLGPAWRAAASARLDRLTPRAAGQDAAILSLREAYAGWQNADASWVVEAGRINLRQGPALGFNPTDYFRDGALRVATTVDPYLVRDYRLGSVMLRAQRLWSDGSMALALSPELADRPSDRGWSASLGATNHRDRALATLTLRHSGNASSQVHLYVERDHKAQVGASTTALLGGSTVAYAEGSWGRDSRLADSALVNGKTKATGGRLAAGLTYTTTGKLALTAEWQYNGFALSKSDARAWRATQPWLLAPYLIESQRLQDSAGRNALLVFAKQTDFVARNLDLSGMWRLNADDRSRLAWVELRYRFKSADIALQWLDYHGTLGSEFGSSPFRSSVQLIGSLYF